MSAWLELPLTRPPPWMNTYTGRLSPALSPVGRWTLTNRQSSASVRGPLVLAAAAQRLPYAVAGTTPDHGAAGRGGRQRSAPVGGAAYRMPRKLSTPSARAPRTAPLSVRTTSESPCCPPV